MITKERRRKIVAVDRYFKHHVNSKVFYPVPKILLNESVLDGLPPELDLGRAAAILYYIAGTIVNKNRDSWYSSKRFVKVALKHEYLSEILGRRFIDYVDFFVEKGIFHVSPYSRGLHCNRYSLNRNCERPFVDTEISDKRVVHAIQKRRLETFEKQQVLRRDLADTLYWFTTEKLVIDGEGARSYLKTLKNRQSLRLAISSCQEEEVLELIKLRFPDQYYQGNRSIKGIEQGKWRISIDAKKGRLYSNLTTIMSPLRNFLTYDGQQMVAIDIKNSQPLHFCFILNEQFWSSQKSKCSLISLKPDLYEALKEDSATLRKVREIVRTQPQDVQEYIHHTSEGNFYEYLSDCLGNKYESFKNRGRSKIRFIQFLNFNDTKKESNSYGDYRRFKELFPNVCTVIEFLKSRYYKDIAAVQQLLEAKMLLHYFMKSFADKFPDVPIYTIHDSIITLNEFKDRAMEVMNEVYTDIFGFAPLTTDELLCPDNAYRTLEDYIDEKANENHPLLQIGEIKLQEYENIKTKFSNYAA